MRLIGYFHSCAAQTRQHLCRLGWDRERMSILICFLCIVWALCQTSEVQSLLLRHIQDPAAFFVFYSPGRGKWLPVEPVASLALTSVTCSEDLLALVGMGAKCPVLSQLFFPLCGLLALWTLYVHSQFIAQHPLSSSKCYLLHRKHKLKKGGAHSRPP